MRRGTVSQLSLLKKQAITIFQSGGVYTDFGALEFIGVISR